MPTYEYLCTSCQHAWEVEQRMTADALTTCPKCSGETAKRQVSGGNFILKGGGWYADLYSSSPKKSETKTETKSETKSESAAPKADAPATSTPSSGGTSGSGGGSST